MESFRRELLYQLPLPLAQLYQRAYNEKDARGRHNNSYFLFEALIKLAAGVRIAAYLEDVSLGFPRVPKLDRCLAALALPSLGQWMQMLRELSRHFGERPDATSHPLGKSWQQLTVTHQDLPAVLALYRRIKNGPDHPPSGETTFSVLGLFESLVQYRNTVIGHGADRTAEFYEREMGPLLFPAINELFDSEVFDVLGSTGLAGSRLVHISQNRRLDEQRIEVSLEELVGITALRIPPLEFPKQEEGELIPGSVAVLWPGRRAPLRLDPLLVYRETTLGGHDVLFLNRDRNRTQVEYLSYTTGQTERDPLMAPALCRLLTRITGNEVDPERLRQLAEQSQSDAPDFDRLFEAKATTGVIVDDFEILGEIGSGGMGVVYLARQTSLGRLVALKMLPGDLQRDEADVAVIRFNREIRALSRCDHPNIVKVIATGRFPDGRLYYAMEYVPGADLEHLWRELSGTHQGGASISLGSSTWNRAIHFAVRKQRSESVKKRSSSASSQISTQENNLPDSALDVPQLDLPPIPEISPAELDDEEYVKRVTELIRDVARALQEVHDQHLIHRDIKPANLMLTPDGSRVVLMDFGLAKGESRSLEASRQAGFLGTLRYAAPEQLQSARIKIGTAADIRGLGVTFWELLTRRRLFGEVEDEVQLIASIEKQDVPHLRTIDKTFDRDLEAIVARATERDPGVRIQTARELADYLDLYLAGKSVPLRTPGLSELFGRWVRERRGIAAATSSALFAVIVTIIVAFRLVTSERDKAIDAQVESEKSRKIADASNQELNEQLAKGLIYRGRIECEADRIDRGIAYFSEAYLRLSNTNHSKLRDSALRLLFTWADYCPMTLSQEGTLETAEFSFDGTMIATVDGEFVQLWDATSGQPIGKAMPQGFDVTSVAFSPDGKKLLAVGWSETSKLWDSGNQSLIMTWTHDTGGVTSVAFSPDGRKILAGCTDNTARLWDADNGQELDRIRDGGWIESVAFSPDGTKILTGSHKSSVKLWDTNSGKPLSLESEISHGDKNIVIRSVAFSPDGTKVLTGGDDRTARLWNAQTGQPLTPPLEHDNTVSSACFSPDGSEIVTASWDGKVRRWSVESGKLISEDEVYGPSYCVRFKANSMSLLVGHAFGQVRKLDLFCDGSGHFLHHAGPVERFQFSRDGAKVVTASQGQVLVWDSKSSTSPLGAFEHGGIVNAMDVSPDSTMVVSGGSDGTAKIWDLKTGSLKNTTVNHYKGITTEHPYQITSVQFSPDGSRFLTGYESGLDGGFVQQWETSTARSVGVFAEQTRGADVSVMEYSPDGSRVLVCWRMTPFYAMLFNSKNGQLITKLEHSHWVYAATFSPDGSRVVTASEDSTLQQWDTSTGKPVGKPMRHFQGVNSVAYSPDGTRILSGAADKVARLWDAKTGQSIGFPMEHPLDVERVDFTLDGQVILTSCGNSILRLWDTETQAPLGRSQWAHGGGASVVFGPSGQYAADGGNSNFVILWDAPNVLNGNDQAIRLWAGVRSGWHHNKHEGLSRIKVDDFYRMWGELRFQHKEFLDLQLTRLKKREHFHCLSLSHYHEVQGSWRSAEFCLNLLIAESPNDPELRRRRGNVLAEQGEWKKASADFAISANAIPTDSLLQFDLGLCQLASGEIDEYCQTCQLILDRFTNSANAEDLSTAAYLSVISPEGFENSKGVLEMADKAVQNAPNDWRILDTLGSAYFRAGNLTKAKQSLRKAIEESGEKSLIESHLFLAMAEQKEGRPAESQKLLKEAKELDSTSADKPFTWTRRLRLKFLFTEAESLISPSTNPE